MIRICTKLDETQTRRKTRQSPTNTCLFMCVSACNIILSTYVLYGMYARGAGSVSAVSTLCVVRCALFHLARKRVRVRANGFGSSVRSSPHVIVYVHAAFPAATAAAIASPATATNALFGVYVCVLAEVTKTHVPLDMQLRHLHQIHGTFRNSVISLNAGCTNIPKTT